MLLLLRRAGDAAVCGGAGLGGGGAGDAIGSDRFAVVGDFAVTRGGTSKQSVLSQRNSACVTGVHTPAKPVCGRHVDGTVVS